ncbi:hypothetical protein JW835_13950 [bacterium]|nr:hypothetical protein [bacterium]
MMKQFQQLFIILSALVIIYFIGCSRPKPLYSTENDVRIMPGGELVPKSMTIARGMSVVWINEDTVMHSIVSGIPENPKDYFSVDSLEPGGEFSVRFDSTGNFLYYCELYPEKITGLIVVAEDTVVREETF